MTLATPLQLYGRVPVSKEKIQRIKIVRLGQPFKEKMWDLDRGLNRGDHQHQKIYGDQYETRFEHILRTAAEDVTAQVIKAYNQAVKPSLKDYVPKREELISAATTIIYRGNESTRSLTICRNLSPTLTLPASNNICFLSLLSSFDSSLPPQGWPG